MLLPLLVAGMSVTDPDGEADAIVLAKEIHLSTVGPLGPVTVVGDSVLLGAGLWSPTLPDRLVEQGWGPIHFRAAVGHYAGPASTSNNAAWWILHWRSQGWEAPNIFVNLGANDSGICRTNLACAKKRIEDLLAVIGPGHQIWWPKITQTPAQSSWAVTWNAALDQVAAERSEFFTWDWPTEMATGGYSSNDNIHLSVDGYRKRSARMAEAFTADLSPADFRLSVVGPLGGVTVVGDSVLLGSGRTVPSVADRLVELGWGPVQFRASRGLGAGPPVGVDDAGWWVELWRSQGWDAPTVLVNVGVNDVEVCGADAGCARQRILAVVGSVGPGRRIWWPKITHGNAGWAAAWNAALDQVAAERAEFFTWDWPTEMAGGGYVSADNVHLTDAGYRQRSERMAAAFTHDLTRSVRVGGDAALPAPTAAASSYQPLTPARVVDTRLGDPGPLGRRAAGSVLAVDFGDRLPVGATAVAINLTADAASAAGYLAAGPCGSPIGGSTVNYTPTATRGAMAVTPLGAGDDVCVFTSAETDIIVDLQGVFVDGDGAGLTPLATHLRLRDTRDSGRAPMLVVNTPPEATAVAVNLTVVNAAAGGWLRAAPCGVWTGVSNVNFGPVEAVAGAAFVTTAADHTICVETNVPADVIVDLTGTFGPGGLEFVPVPPTRMLDTRNTIGGWAPIHGSGQTLDIQVTPPGATAVTGTITQVEPITGGYLTAYPCPTKPNTSSVNADPGLVLANALTTGVSTTGRLCIYTQPTTHTLFDVTGWWTPPPPPAPSD